MGKVRSRAARWAALSTLIFAGVIAPGRAADATTPAGPSWTVAPVLQISGEQVRPEAIAATTGGDVWVVGYVYTGIEFRTLALRRHAGRWAMVATPDVETQPAEDFLNGVVALGPNDVWMVGSSATSVGNLASKPLVEHWDGSSVSLVPVPSPGPGSALTAVSGIGSDLWVVGAGPGIDSPATRLVMHFDGIKWTTVAMPVIVTGCANRYGANLTSVVRVGPGHIYVGGACTTGNDDTDSRGFVEQYDNSAWTASVSAPGLGSIDGLATSSLGTVWAVGWRQATGGGPTTSWGVAYHGSGTSFAAHDQKAGSSGTTNTFEGVTVTGAGPVVVGTATSPQPPFVGFGGFTHTSGGWSTDPVANSFSGFGRFTAVTTDSNGRVVGTGFGISSSGDDVGVAASYSP